MLSNLVLTPLLGTESEPWTFTRFFPHFILPWTRRALCRLAVTFRPRKNNSWLPIWILNFWVVGSRAWNNFVFDGRNLRWHGIIRAFANFLWNLVRPRTWGFVNHHNRRSNRLPKPDTRRPYPPQLIIPRTRHAVNLREVTTLRFTQTERWRFFNPLIHPIICRWPWSIFLERWAKVRSAWRHRESTRVKGAQRRVCTRSRGVLSPEDRAWFRGASEPKAGAVNWSPDTGVCSRSGHLIPVSRGFWCRAYANPLRRYRRPEVIGPGSWGSFNRPWCVFRSETVR
jgi:hypothetical protein